MFTRVAAGVTLALVVAAAIVARDREPDSTAALEVAAGTIGVLVAAFLVLWMKAGFACLEAGLCRAKNAANIPARHFIMFAVSTWLPTASRSIPGRATSATA